MNVDAPNWLTMISASNRHQGTKPTYPKFLQQNKYDTLVLNESHLEMNSRYGTKISYNNNHLPNNVKNTPQEPLTTIWNDTIGIAQCPLKQIKTSTSSSQQLYPRKEWLSNKHNG
jgi:hypothetical protein